MEQKGVSKKSVYIIIGLILLGMAAFFGKRFLEEHQQNKEYQMIIQTEKNIAESSFPVILDSKEKDNQFITTFIPLDESGEQISNIAEKMMTYLQEVDNGTIQQEGDIIFIKAMKQEYDDTINVIMIENSSYILNYVFILDVY